MRKCHYFGYNQKQINALILYFRYSKISEFIRARKSKVFQREEIEKFLSVAPDELYLSTKVVLIIAVAEACRCDDLLQMKTDDINDMVDKLLNILPNTKNKRSRSFVVTEYLTVYRNYAASRLSNLTNQRKAHQSSVKCQKKEYTGHCFRRTSATLALVWI